MRMDVPLVVRDEYKVGLLFQPDCALMCKEGKTALRKSFDGWMSNFLLPVLVLVPGQGAVNCLGNTMMPVPHVSTQRKAKVPPGRPPHAPARAAGRGNCVQPGRARPGA